LALEFIGCPRYIYFGPQAHRRVAEIMDTIGVRGTVLLLSGSSKTKKIGGMVGDVLRGEGFDVVDLEVPSGVIGAREVCSLYEKVRNKGISIVLGVGGGRVIDASKVIAAWKGVEYISVPTSASHDGIASPSISFLLRKSISESLGPEKAVTRSPIGIIADTEIIKNAPPITLISGCGDLIAKYTAVRDWKLASVLKDEPFSEYSASIALLSARLITDHAPEIKPSLEESCRIVVKALIGSGIAISVAGSSRPASGSEHLFSHAIDYLSLKEGFKPAPHGIQCGLGTIMMSYLQGGEWEFIRQKLRELGAPVTAEEANLSPKIIIKALTICHTIRNRYTILGDSGLTENAAYKLALKTGVIEKEP